MGSCESYMQEEFLGITSRKTTALAESSRSPLFVASVPKISGHFQ